MSNAVVRKDKRRKGRRPPRDTTKAEVSRFAGDAYDLASRAVRGVQYITKLINIETKYVDTISSASLTTTPTVVYVSALAQGTDVSNRVGDSIRIQGLSYAFTLYGNTASTGVTQVRVMLVRDLQNQGATPTTTDVITNLSAVAQPVYLQRTRYNILYDESVLLFRETGPLVDMRKGSIAQNGHIRYRGTTTAVTSAAEGSLFLMAFSTAVSNAPTLDYSVRLLYTDD